MLIKIKTLRQEINLSRDYSHLATSRTGGEKEWLGNILSCHLNKTEPGAQQHKNRLLT